MAIDELRPKWKSWQRKPICFCSSIASLEFVTRDNGFPRGFDGHEVPSNQQLVAGEIRKAKGVVGKHSLQFEAKGL